jgi:acylphosphatase
VGHFEGAAGDVDALVDWCRSGPERAQVDDVRVTEAEPGGNRGFDVLG